MQNKEEEKNNNTLTPRHIILNYRLSKIKNTGKNTLLIEEQK